MLLLDREGQYVVCVRACVRACVREFVFICRCWLVVTHAMYNEPMTISRVKLYH
jgi:hypothetical protein